MFPKATYAETVGGYRLATLVEIIHQVNSATYVEFGRVMGGARKATSGSLEQDFMESKLQLLASMLGYEGCCRIGAFGFCVRIWAG